MSPALKHIKDIVLSLPEDDRYEIIDALVNDARRPTTLTDVDKAWLEESIRRSEALDRGELTYRDAFEAIEDVYKKLLPKK
jgi:hypothetical protein